MQNHEFGLSLTFKPSDIDTQLIAHCLEFQPCP
jgi:hypothetical protein